MSQKNLLRHMLLAGIGFMTMFSYGATNMKEIPDELKNRQLKGRMFPNSTRKTSNQSLWPMNYIQAPGIS